MAKSLKSLLSKINLVDLAVVLVLVAVLMCLMKKMDVVEGLCVVNETSLNNNCAPGVHPYGCAFDGNINTWRNKCLSTSDADCGNISVVTGEFDTRLGVSSGCMLHSETIEPKIMDRVSITAPLDEALSGVDITVPDTVVIDPDCSQENMDLFARPEGSARRAAYQYGEGEICVGTYHRRDGSEASCTSRNMVNRDDCAGTRGCRVKQC